MSDDSTAEFRDGMPFLGGRLWIDLLNTTPVVEGQSQDLLAGGGVLRWARAAGLPQEPSGLAALPGLRDLLRPAFEHLARGAPLPETVLAAVNRLLAGLRLELRLEQGAEGPRLTQSEAADAATLVALDFARFASLYEAQRLKHCANPACTMVFHDHGRNNRRRWCAMELCGNRDKVARFRARQRP